LSTKANLVFKSGKQMEIVCENLKIGRTKDGSLASISFSKIDKSSPRPMYLDVKELAGVFVERDQDEAPQNTTIN